MADIIVTASGVLQSTSAFLNFAYNAGAEITAGQFVYLDNTNLWQLVDADSATGTEITRTFGVAVNHAYTGQRLVVSTKDTDFTPGATLVAGTTYVGSTTPGGICPASDLAAGDYPVVVGIAKSTTKLNLNPSAAGAAI